MIYYLIGKCGYTAVRWRRDIKMMDYQNAKAGDTVETVDVNLAEIIYRSSKWATKYIWLFNFFNCCRHCRRHIWYYHYI